MSPRVTLLPTRYLTLTNLPMANANTVRRQRLHSASHHQLIVPWHHHTNFGSRAFTVAGPTAWNSLPDYLHDLSLSEDTFRRPL